MYTGVYMSATGDHFRFEQEFGETHATIHCDDGNIIIRATADDVGDAFSRWLSMQLYKQNRPLSINGLVIDPGELFWLMACVDATNHMRSD